MLTKIARFLLPLTLLLFAVAVHVHVSWLPGQLTRVAPSLASDMPKIKAPGTDQAPLTMAGSGRKYLRRMRTEQSTQIAP